MFALHVQTCLSIYNNEIRIRKRVISITVAWFMFNHIRGNFMYRDEWF